MSLGGRERIGEGGRVYSWMMVGRKTGMELKATLQAKNMNCLESEWTFRDGGNLGRGSRL